MEYKYNGIENYSYSAFEGREFLESYKDNRVNTIVKLGSHEMIMFEDMMEKLIVLSEASIADYGIAYKILLSILCMYQYHLTKDIRFLNSCLKLNDYICANTDKIVNNTLKNLAYSLIFYELEAVKDTMANIIDKI